MSGWADWIAGTLACSALLALIAVAVGRHLKRMSDYYRRPR